MLRIVVSPSAAAAKKYFVEGLGSGDYYASGSYEPGVWGGKAAAELGLSGEVGKKAFERLCDNRRPDLPEQLTPRNKANRRVGYDINFHCPKSVSLVHALTGDTAILKSFKDAVAGTMALIEAEAKTRVRVDGKYQDRLTGNLAWATFVHQTARPINGIPDPHLHAHCFTFNATHDDVEQRWKAAQLGDVKRDAAYFEACFHSLLSSALRDLGYSIVRHGRSWEIAGVSKGLLDRFSNRTAQIDAVAKERGITDAAEKATLGAKTRRGKRESVPLEEVHRDWKARTTPEERVSLRRLKEEAGGSPAVTAKEAVDYAARALFERSSVVTEKELVEKALRAGFGTVRPPEALAALSGPGFIRKPVDDIPLITTPTVLAEERWMVDYARGGRGVHPPLVKTSGKPSPSSSLSPQQQNAARTIFDSTDTITLIRGAAGTGKTTMMRAVVDELEHAGHRVTVLAPSTDASRGTLREAGFQGADTVASFLAGRDQQEGARGGVLWVDEAGLLGVRTLVELFRVTATLGCRLILSGDFRQHGPVERGDALRLLEQQAGLRSAELTEIRRQRGEYKAAVADLSKGNVIQGFERLERLKAVHEVAEYKDRLRAASDAYLGTIRAGQSAVIICPTHAAGEKVTAVVREELKRRRELSDSRLVERLTSKGLTEADRGRRQNFSEGDVVQFHLHAPGFKAAGRYEVLDQSGNREEGVILVRHNGQVLRLPLAHAERFDVFQKKELDLAVGDIIRITKNGKTFDGKSNVHNGTTHKVGGFTSEGNVVLSDGRVLDANYGHLSHSYCITSHASQSRAFDHVIVFQGAESYRVASDAQFYVSSSRGVKKISIFTDDVAQLRDAILRSGSKTGATELVIREEAGLEQLRAPTGFRERYEEREHGR